MNHVSRRLLQFAFVLTIFWCTVSFSQTTISAYNKTTKVRVSQLLTDERKTGVKWRIPISDEQPLTCTLIQDRITHMECYYRFDYLNLKSFQRLSNAWSAFDLNRIK